MIWLSLFFALGAEPPPLAFPLAPDPELDSGCPWVPVELAFVGDVMVHGQQLAAARGADGTYDFHPVFSAVAPILRRADLGVANLETTIAGPALRFTGYPAFNSPVAVLDALSGAGVDVLQTANNHSFDRGMDGVRSTLDAVERRGMTAVGTYRTGAERAEPWRLVQAQPGVRVAFLAYTLRAENVRLAGVRETIALIEPERMIDEVAAARASGAELVVVGVHWGQEYQYRPDLREVHLARALVQAGADIVVGTHPHVVQPAEVVSVRRDGQLRYGLVLYSLGNFVSNQRSLARAGGVIARVTALRCPLDGEVRLSSVEFVPTWVDRHANNGKLAYRVHPISDGPRCEGPGLDADDCARMEDYRGHLATLLPAEQSRSSHDVPAWRWLALVGTRPLADPRIAPAAFRFVPASLWPGVE